MKEVFSFLFIRAFEGQFESFAFIQVKLYAFIPDFHFLEIEKYREIDS